MRFSDGVAWRAIAQPEGRTDGDGTIAEKVLRKIQQVDKPPVSTTTKEESEWLREFPTVFEEPGASLPDNRIKHVIRLKTSAVPYQKTPYLVVTGTTGSAGTGAKGVHRQRVDPTLTAPHGRQCHW